MKGAKLDSSSAGGRARSASAVRRLVIVAEKSLLVEAICIAFHRSGEFELVGHADGRRTSARMLLDAQPDVILLDDMRRSERALELARAIRCENEMIAVIVLGVQLDPDWLERIFEAGATGAISTSTHPVVLATLVRETLRGHIFHRQTPVRSTTAAPQPTITNEDFPLTERELEILGLVASGSTNGDVARRLWVTEQTVKFHLRNIYRKLDVVNRTQASHVAHVNGLVKSRATLAVTPQPEPTVS
jgi:DNA-binding NarL/FixJ family response regulator